MQTFCDAIFLRAGEATAYCERFPLDDKTAQAEQLLQLLHSLMPEVLH